MIRCKIVAIAVNNVFPIPNLQSQFSSPLMINDQLQVSTTPNKQFEVLNEFYYTNSTTTIEAYFSHQHLYSYQFHFIFCSFIDCSLNFVLIIE